MSLIRFDRKTPCYICGRDTGGKCGISSESNLLHCWAVGDTFAPPADALRKKGATTKGANGLEYAFVGLAGSGDEWALFKVHEQIEETHREWVYEHVDGGPCVVVHRVDSYSGKKMWQAPAGGHPKVPSRKVVLPYGRIGSCTVVVEGESTCDAVLAIGLDCVTFLGGSNGDPSTLVVAEGQRFVLAPDRDRVGIEYMLRVYDHIIASGGQVRWLYANPTSSRWDDPGDGYDLADWLAAGATLEDLREAITDTPRVEAEPEVVGFWGLLPRQDKLTTLAPDELQNLILHNAGDQLRWNLLTNTLELDGAELKDADLCSTYIDFSARNIKVCKEEAVTQLIRAARTQSYHPVRQFLEECYQPLPAAIWENIAGELLGSNATPLDNSLLRKWLISAVARIYEPGQRADFMFVLAGAGATHKTRFFGTLIGWDWFQEGFQDDIKQKDALMKCHRFWVTEMGEVDGMTSKRAAAEVKNFITTKLDALRAPYGRSVEMYKRQFVLCATTNRTDGFLVDDTGNRRFAVFQVEQQIDVEKVRQLRRQIWASARRDYLAGADWNMSPDELVSNEGRNDDWMQDDPWAPAIHSYISVFQPDQILVPDLLAKKFELPAKDQHQGHLARVSRILKAVGYAKRRRRIGGHLLTVWESPAKAVSR